MNLHFLYPGFLFALFAISIPILIHLFNFRKYRTVYFTNVRFLREITEETQAKSKLKHLLVLLSRILFLVFTVFAFAQPFIPAAASMARRAENIVSVYIDNSFSMDAEGANGKLIEEAKQRAVEIAKAYPPSTQFQLLTNEFEGKQQRLLSLDEFFKALDEVKQTSVARKISEAVLRQQDAIHAEKSSAEGTAYLISDFQKSIADVEGIVPDTTISLRFLPLKAEEQDNVFIDTCMLASPAIRADQSLVLKVSIKNYSGKDLENIPVKLFINGVQKALASTDIKNNSTETVALSFTLSSTGYQQGYVVLTDDPVTFDDTWYLSFFVTPSIRVLSINGRDESRALRSLFGSDSLFQLTNSSQNQIDYSAFLAYNLIVLNEPDSVSSGLAQELKKFCENGGSVVLFPFAEAGNNAYSLFFTACGADLFSGSDTSEIKVEKFDVTDELFRDVFQKNTRPDERTDLPVVHKHFRIPLSGRSHAEVLLRLENKAPFLNRYGVKKGKLYVFAAPLSGHISNFTRHAMFVPVMYKIAMLSKGYYPLSYAIGRDEAVEFSSPGLSAEQVFHLVKEGTGFEIIPEHKTMGGLTSVLLHNRITEAGNYTLKAEREVTRGLSFNYDRKESYLACLTDKELTAKLAAGKIFNGTVLETGAAGLTHTLQRLNEGIKLWKVCIILALLFLGIETALLKFWK